MIEQEGDRVLHVAVVDEVVVVEHEHRRLGELLQQRGQHLVDQPAAGEKDVHGALTGGRGEGTQGRGEVREEPVRVSGGPATATSVTRRP